jgi:23S rRNA (guanosine2251-2'-O)-methyltransferase
MAKQHHKRPRRTTSAGSHQVNWLWGQQSVLETIHVNRWRVYELFVTAEVSHQHKAILKAKQKEGVELETVSVEKLTELANTTEHEGIIARVSKYPYESMDILESARTTEPMALATSSAQPTGGKSIQPLIVVIDRIQDAFTFASILRCCQAAQVSAVIVGQFCQAQVTTQIARASSNAVSHFPIVQSDDLESAAQHLKDLGFELIAIDSQSQTDVCDTPLNLPAALVLASDTLGLDPKLQELCNHRVRIPTFGKATTLHSVVRAGILLYETRRQQREKIK